MRRLLKRTTVSKPLKKYQQWLKRNWWWLLIGLTAFTVAFLAFVLDNWWPRTGFNGKTLWEWLELLGVPLTLAILGYFLQQQEQKRAREEAKQQREIAADEAKDEILQAYFDRISVLLVDKNLLAIASKIYPRDEDVTGKQQDSSLSDEQREQLDKARKVARAQVVTPEQQELFDAAIDVIRARTLSILRRFEGDGERKTSVIQFLLEAEVINKARLALNGSDLSDTDLHLANLSGADLSDADLRGADLRGAILSYADLRGADLRGAILSYANFRGTNLIGADLRKADLSYAIFSYVNLRGAKLRGAKLRGSTLIGSTLMNIRWDFETDDFPTEWLDPKEAAKAENIPDALKKQLKLPPYDTKEPEPNNMTEKE